MSLREGGLPWIKGEGLLFTVQIVSIFSFLFLLRIPALHPDLIQKLSQHKNFPALRFTNIAKVLSGNSDRSIFPVAALFVGEGHLSDDLV